MSNQFSAFNPQSKRCSLCLNMKLEILEDKENNLLSKKSEVISKCRHYIEIKILYNAIFNVRTLNIVKPKIANDAIFVNYHINENCYILFITNISINV